MEGEVEEDGGVVGAVGGADAPGGWLEFRAVEDVIDGCGEERVPSVPGGLETASATGVLEPCFLRDARKEMGPGTCVEITHEENRSLQLRDQVH